jgi:magnesium-transporting ATPase (P-type)
MDRYDELVAFPRLHRVDVEARPFYQSRPGKPLWVATVIVLAVTLALPYLPLNKWLGFSPLPASFILVFAGITAGYLIASEMTKKIFYRRAHYELLGCKPDSRINR